MKNIALLALVTLVTMACSTTTSNTTETCSVQTEAFIGIPVHKTSECQGTSETLGESTHE